MIQDLLNYQARDKELKDIENILSGNEERKKAVNARKYLDGVNESVNKLDDKAGSLSNEYLKAVQLQEKLFEQEKEIASALDNAGTENEVSFLVKKAEELISQIKNVNAIISNLSNDIQAILREYSSIKAKTNAAKIQYKENSEKYKEFKNPFDDKMKSIKADLEKLKEKVEPELMEKYLKKRANKIYPIVYEVSDKVCGACNMELSMAELNKLKNGEIIECDQCGRILFQANK